MSGTVRGLSGLRGSEKPALLMFALIFFADVSFPALAFAQAAAPAAGPMVGPGDFIIQTVMYMLMIFFVYFLLVLKPAMKKEDEQKKFLDSLKRNDEVVTSGGIYGRISQVKPDSVTLEIAPQIRIKVDPKHIQSLPKVPAVTAETTEKKE